LSISVESVRVFNSVYLILPNDFQELYDVCSAFQVLQYLDFTFYLLLLHGLEHFDDDFFAFVFSIDSFENFTVFSPPNFPRDFVWVLLSSNI
jgi:hypothetical protein